MWWMAAAAAAPYVASMFQDKPDRPAAPAPVKMTNRDGDIASLLNDANNPNTEFWLNAQQRTMDEVNRALGRRGALGSSLGMQLQGNTQAQLAENWLKEQVARKKMALDTALNYDRGQAGFQNEQNAQQYGYAMDNYKDQIGRNVAQIQGISNLVNAGVGAYQYQQSQDRLDRYEQMMKKDPYPQVQIGMPYQMPASHNPFPGSVYG